MWPSHYQVSLFYVLYLFPDLFDITDRTSTMTRTSESSISLKDEAATRPVSGSNDSKFYDSSSLLNYMIVGGVALLLINLLILLAIMRRDRKKRACVQRSITECEKDQHQEPDCHTLVSQEPDHLFRLRHEMPAPPPAPTVVTQEVDPILVNGVNCMEWQSGNHHNMSTIETILLTDHFYDASDKQTIISDQISPLHQMHLSNQQQQQQHPLSNMSSTDPAINECQMIATTPAVSCQQQERKIRGIMKGKTSSASTTSCSAAGLIGNRNLRSGDTYGDYLLKDVQDIGILNQHHHQQQQLYVKTDSPNISACSTGNETTGGAATTTSASSPLFDSSSSIGSCTLITGHPSSPYGGRNYSSSLVPSSSSVDQHQQHCEQQQMPLTVHRNHRNNNSGQSNNNRSRQVTWHVISENCEICDLPSNWEHKSEWKETPAGHWKEKVSCWNTWISDEMRCDKSVIKRERRKSGTEKYVPEIRNSAFCSSSWRFIFTQSQQ